MAGWYKQHTSELASLEVYLRCGRVDVLSAWLRVTRMVVDTEFDEVPEVLREDVALLEQIGLFLPFKVRCKDLLEQRESMAKLREAKKAHVKSRELTQGHVPSRDSQRELVRVREEGKEEIKEIRERASRRVRVASPDFSSWVPKDDHRRIALEVGVDLETEVAAMGDWLKAEGKTKKDYDAFARNWIRRAKNRPANWSPAKPPATAKAGSVHGYGEELNILKMGAK